MNNVRVLSKKFKITNIRIKKNNNLRKGDLCKKNIDINDINYSKKFWELNKEYKKWVYNNDIIRINFKFDYYIKI